MSGAEADQRNQNLRESFGAGAAGFLGLASLSLADQRSTTFAVIGGLVAGLMAFALYVWLTSGRHAGLVELVRAAGADRWPVVAAVALVGPFLLLLTDVGVVTESTSAAAPTTSMAATTSSTHAPTTTTAAVASTVPSDTTPTMGEESRSIPDCSDLEADTVEPCTVSLSRVERFALVYGGEVRISIADVSGRDTVTGSIQTGTDGPIADLEDALIGTRTILGAECEYVVTITNANFVGRTADLLIEPNPAPAVRGPDCVSPEEPDSQTVACTVDAGVEIQAQELEAACTPGFGLFLAVPAETADLPSNLYDVSAWQFNTADGASGIRFAKDETQVPADGGFVAIGHSDIECWWQNPELAKLADRTEWSDRVQEIRVALGSDVRLWIDCADQQTPSGVQLVLAVEPVE